ncbi:protein transport protein Sec16A-like isoform X2 [Rhincodon typus]|uniref:protein transport protein Sec16A-like isoform X2 n=1 Tax=Rhincodon typus TaxID=259920 RepID=UPI00202E9FCB|nr:protein transport protein Sec16A-like isoform X2 [Rhincodon typus]
MKAGTKGRYVDVLNPSGSRPGGVLMPPVDLFAPLAPMPIPTNLFVPMSGEGSQPSEGNPGETSQPVEQANAEATAQPQIFNPIPNADSSPPEPDNLQHGEPSAGTTGSRPGRFGQRKYPTLN